MASMIDQDEIADSPANLLCKACGLCCTGHLFIWTKLRSAELGSIEALGLPVIRSIPSERGFNQPCPLWKGQCTIYHSPHYPRFCHTYKCRLLKKLLEESTSLSQALSAVKGAKELIQEVDVLLPDSPNPNFRERLVEHLEETAAQKDRDPGFRQRAEALLVVYEQVFGVDDVIESP